MSELFDRAARMRQTQTAMEAERLRAIAEADAETRRKMEESRERAQEFVGHMVANHVAPLPVYAHVYHKVRSSNIVHPFQSVPNHAMHLGEGWLVRQGYYEYEEGTVDSLVVTREADVYSCVRETTNHIITNPAFRVPESEYFLETGMRHVDENRTRIGHVVFAGEQGLNLLANGLILNNLA